MHSSALQCSNNLNDCVEVIQEMALFCHHNKHRNRLDSLLCVLVAENAADHRTTKVIKVFDKAGQVGCQLVLVNATPVLVHEFLRLYLGEDLI